jgi:hypothetical protein
MGKSFYPKSAVPSEGGNAMELSILIGKIWTINSQTNMEAETLVSGKN